MNPLRSIKPCTVAALALVLATAALAQGSDSPAPLGKPSAGLTIDNPADGVRLEVGQVQTLELDLRSRGPAGQLTLDVSSADPRLEVLSASPTTLDLGSDQPLQVSVQLLAQEPGRYRLMLAATLSEAGTARQQQVLGVSVQAGEQPIEAFKNDAAPGVISLPAQETIRKAP